MVQVLRSLAVEPQDVLGLVLAHWWTDLGYGVSSWARVPRSSVSLLIIRLVSDIAGCGVWDI